MPTLKLTDLASCKAYFLNLATLHKEVDSLRWGDLDLLQKDSKSSLPARTLWVKPYDGANYSGDSSDNIVKMKVLEIRYMIVPASQSQQHMEEAASTTEAVIEQFIAKLFQDKTGYMNGTGEWEMISFRTSSMETENFEITIGSVRYVGCELKITFMENTNLEYDASKWN